VPVLSVKHTTEDAVGFILEDLAGCERRANRDGRPFVTLAWAQSIDGSIAAEPGERCHLSGTESLRLTHALRAWHRAIVVGIGTVLADDPQLTVRFWSGRNPTPVVLDSRLRTPPSVRLLAEGRTVPTWIACTATPDSQQRSDIEKNGGRLISLPALENGWVDPKALLCVLGEAGFTRVMIEGGAKVLSSFLHAGLADYAVVTIAPCLLGGLPVLGAPNGGLRARFSGLRTVRLADDQVVAGAFDWERE